MNFLPTYYTHSSLALNEMFVFDDNFSLGRVVNVDFIRERESQGCPHIHPHYRAGKRFDQELIMIKDPQVSQYVWWIFILYS